MKTTHDDSTKDSPVTPESVEQPAAARPKESTWRRLSFDRRIHGSVTPLAFLVAFACFGLWQGGVFLNVPARILDLHSNTPILLLAVSLMVTLLAGQFDLSAASMATLSTFLTVGLVVDHGWPFWLVLIATLTLGVLGGLINGLLVTRLRINTFIATLGTGGAFVGLSSVLSQGSSIVPSVETPLPGWFSGLGSFGTYTTKAPLAVSLLMIVVLLAIAHISAGRLRPTGVSDSTWRLIEIGAAVLVLLIALALRSWLHQVTWPVVLLVAVGVVVWVLFRLTVTGRNIQAVGSNPLAARLAGVRTDREVVKAFMIGGLLASVAGIVLAAQQGSATPDVATGFLLPAFAAAFLSTVVFSAGRFNVWGTIIGGTFLLWVGQGLIVGGLPFTWLPVVNGIVLIVAVASSTFIQRSQR